MKPLILYSTHSGNNQGLAFVLAETMNCPAEQLREKRKRTMFTFFIELITKRLPRINEINHNLSDYDHLILISPVWFGKPSAPMISFMDKYAEQISRYSFISLCGGSMGPNKDLRSFLESRLHKTPCGFAELYVNDMADESIKNDPSEIMKLKLDKADIQQHYTEQIKEFAASLS